MRQKPIISFMICQAITCNFIHCSVPIFFSWFESPIIRTNNNHLLLLLDFNLILSLYSFFVFFSTLRNRTYVNTMSLLSNTEDLRNMRMKSEKNGKSKRRKRRQKKLKINDDALSIAPGDICILPTE